VRQALPLLLFLGACGSPGSDLVANGFECPEGAAPFGLTLVDSVTLEETPSTLLGNPAITFSAGSDGTIFVPDNELNRISVYRGDGTLRGLAGRAGGGPGEFLRISTFGVVRDSLLLHADGAGNRINIYDTRTLAYLGQIPYEGYFSFISTARDGFVLGLLSTFGAASVSNAQVAAALAGVSQAPVRSDRVARPEEYRRYPMLNAWQDVKAVEWGTGVLAVFGATDYLISVDSTGTTDTVRIPICGRRGAPKARLDRLYAVRPESGSDYMALREITDTSISSALGLWQMPDGAFLLQFQDPTFEQGGRVFMGVAWLTLISSDLTRACVDTRVESPGSERARVTVSGDSIFVLDQVADEQLSGSARTVVRKYLIDRTSCRWIRVAS
jgi:hypothetical protein